MKLKKTMNTPRPNPHKKNTLRAKYLLCAFVFTIWSPTTFALNEIQLPSLGGGTGGGIISPAQERELGQRWQRAYRSQIPTSTDPFLQNYIENLVQKLSIYSDLEDKRVDVLVIENPTLNAFAVPGGVMGVHTGLLNYAKNEEQFSSVIAHELAHLSQHHYARQLSEQRDNNIPNMAALLGSILLAVTAGGDAGIAAIATTQAVLLDQQLRFSRELEQEADRVGMKTMVRANYDPYSMPEMFEEMLYASRFSRRPPEFLLTHPLTESRVSDSKQRAQQYPRKPPVSSLEYQLLKARIRLLHESNTVFTLKYFTEQLAREPETDIINRYGLAITQLKMHNAAEAKKTLSPLLERYKSNLFFIIAMAEIETELGDTKHAIARLQTSLDQYKDNHPVNIKMAEILMRDGQYDKAEILLDAHSKRRPKDDYVWYLLAEIHGLAGNILQVHLARTEYFMLNGLFDKAENQIRNGLTLAKGDARSTRKLEQRLKEVRRMRRETL